LEKENKGQKIHYLIMQLKEKVKDFNRQKEKERKKKLRTIEIFTKKFPLL